MDALMALSPLSQNYGLPGAGSLGGFPGLGMASNRAMGLGGGGQDFLMQSMQMIAMETTLIQMLARLMLGQAGGNPQALSNLAQGIPGIGSGGGGCSGGSCGGSSVGSGGGGGGASSLGSSSGGGSVGQASAQPKDQNEIDSFIKDAAGAYGADPNVLREIARRESNFKADAVNNWDSNAKKGTPSKGMFQFIEPTFMSYAKQAKAANPKAWEGLGELNWMDWRQQALTCAWAIKNGHGSAWATYSAAGGK